MLTATKHGKVVRIELARTILGRGRYWTTAYLIGQTLIDSGPAHTAVALSNHLREMPLKQILNTHAHEDHIGANGLLQRQRPSLKIFAHPIAIPVLKNPVEQQPLQLYRRVMWGWPEASNPEAVSDGDILEDGDLRWHVLYTPGHTAHHLCFYEPERGWLFSGDLFIGGRDRALGAGNDIWAIIASLKRLVELPLKVLYPGSAHVRSNPQSELKDRIDYLEDLGGRITALHKQGWSEGRIAREISGGPMMIEFITAGHFSRRHLVHSFLNPKSYGD